MRLRNHLLILIAATLLPMALFAVGGALLLAEREREAFHRGASERVRALMTAVDAELRGHITTLQALAALPAFDGDDLGRMRVDAERVLRAQPDWLTIIVLRPDGEQLMNLLVPPGAPLPKSPDPEVVRRVAEAARPLVGDVTLRAALAPDRAVFPVRAPVVREGKVKYVLTAGLEATTIRRLLDQQSFPEGWIGAVIDGNQRFVARTMESADARAGGEVSASLKQALASRTEGWQEGRVAEGRSIYRAWRRSNYSGWATSVAVASAVVQRSTFDAALLLVIGALLAVGAGGALAALLARRIAAPIAQLAAAAPRLGEGAAPPQAAGESAVREVRELAQALRAAERNIADREAKQKEAENALRAADRAKDEFLAMLGHELRNPLAALTTSAELLRVGRRDAALVDSAQQMIARQTGHMAHMVDDLLEVSRVTSGKIRLEKEPVDLAVIAANVLATWHDAGRLARHRVSDSLESAWVDGDAARIEQIISNLLDNAVKYTPAGGAIRVAVRSDAGQALVEVADEGEGIAPEMIERVFELFVQGERGLARQQGGLGIGLTLARRLAELHGGELGAQSAGRNRGATFTLRLAAIAPPAAPALPARAPAASGGARILLVEDNADARDSLARLLSLSGHSVSTAATANDALHAVARAQHDVALVDIGLPDMDGYQLARRLRKAAESRPMWLVALTGYGKDEDRAAATDAGFDEHLTKPVDLERLERLIADLRSRRAA